MLKTNLVAHLFFPPLSVRAAITVVASLSDSLPATSCRK